MAVKKTTTKLKPRKISPKLAAKQKKSKQKGWTLPKYLAEQRAAKKRYKKAHPPMKLPGVLELTRTSIMTIVHHWRLFTGICAIYAFLNLVFARGLTSAAAVSSLKNALLKVQGGHTKAIGTSISSFVSLGSNSNNSTNTTAGVYQFLLIVIVSLALIWALKQAGQERKVTIRESYYRGMYPLIPFMMIIVITGIMLLPLIAGSTLYTQVVNNGIAIGTPQRLFWLAVFLLLTLLSLYWITSAIIALYVSTQPLMTPIKALKTANKYVEFQRSAVMLRIIFLPIILLAVVLIIVVPVALWVTRLTQLVYFLLTILVVVLINSYLFNLYKVLSTRKP